MLLKLVYSDDDSDCERPLLPKQSAIKNRCRLKSTVVVAAVFVILVSVLISVTVAVLVIQHSNGGFHSVAHIYSKAAVVSDHESCSQIGSDIMRLQNGSATDAAVAMVLCIGVTGLQASGIGGGHFMVIYDIPNSGGEKEVFTIDAREIAPASATKDMFRNKTHSGNGGPAIGVPGEVLGLYKAWKKFGRLPWRDVVLPSVKLCREGFTIKKIVQDRLKRTLTLLNMPDISFPKLKDLLLKDTGEPYREGDIMKRPQLANTLEQLADDPMGFYEGQMAKDIVNDINEAGGNFSLDDLKSYSVKTGPAMHVLLANGTLDLYVPNLPSGGPIYQFMMRILDGYKFQQGSVNDLKDNTIFHQILLETFKFGMAMRSYMADEDFVDVHEAISNVTSEEFVSYIRSRIDQNHTHDVLYYGSAYLPVDDHGTAHVSVMSPDGGAVAVTSSINFYFGSLVVGNRTGIIFNNQMDDFSSPDQNNDWGLSPSAANFIAPGKRPLSSMTPAIIIDHQTKEVHLAIGGAGGSKISTMMAFVTYLNVYLGLDLKEAIDFPRVHHQLLPDVARYENDVNKDVLFGLQNKGHALSSSSFLAVVNGIERICDTSGYPCRYRAVGDGRRQSVPGGWS